MRCEKIKYFFQSLSSLQEYFIYLFLERGRDREKGEKHQCMVAYGVPPTGDLAHNPGMCPRLGVEPVTLWFAGQCSIH